MSENTVVTSVSVEATEAEMFAAAVAAIPNERKGKKQRSKDGANKAEKPVVSKYAAKRQATTQTFAQEPVVAPVMAAPVAVEPETVSNLLSGLDVDLFGDAVGAMEEMLALRDEGFGLIARANAMNIREAEFKAKQLARQFENAVPKDVARFLFEELGRKQDHRSKLMVTTLNILREEFNKQGGDPFKRQKYIDVVLAAVMRDPIQKEKHEGNLARAEKVMAELAEKIAARDALLAQGAEKLDLANILAEENGWPKTEAHRKEVVTSTK